MISFKLFGKRKEQVVSGVGVHRVLYRTVTKSAPNADLYLLFVRAFLTAREN